MELHYYNCPEPKSMDNAVLPEPPAFLLYQPNFQAMEEVTREYGDAENIIIIGHGGSITSFLGLSRALVEKIERSGKRVHFVYTIDPDYITRIKAIASPEDSVVLSISKSGEDVTQIEATLQFANYPLIVITSEPDPLSKLAELANVKIVTHPVIGGRFTAFTEVALLPAMFAGLDVHAFTESGKKFLSNYATENEAWKAASALYQLEQKGFVDVLVPFYNSALFGISNLVVQLCHESFGKDGQGQTYFAHEGPEVQHHTLQRFIGGRKNIAGWFHSVKRSLNELQTSVPHAGYNIPIKTGSLGNLDNISLNDALNFECEATIEDASAQGIPLLRTILEDRSETSLGELIAFWQLFAVYSSVLRDVDPFDQPQVEASKKISFQKRLSHSS